MASPGKRALASLFGVHLNEDAPKLTSLVPQRISNEIMTGQLPKFNPSTLMLGKNETCHFMDKAAEDANFKAVEFWQIAAICLQGVRIAIPAAALCVIPAKAVTSALNAM
ncbi:PTS sugar transporter subunit IIC, partial [Butyrivibrio sp.]|uniref:PTS sugar transporter subunit IIC n=1 Tax=Butyrivibrio sp. TaxID=28121 RepID=UPI0025B982E0